MSPKQIYKWHTVERIARETAENFGFHETRIPTFESTDLFLRSVGETTDVVQKEMYTVKAKETEFTLRPEGTAGTIRSILQNGLLNDALPQKVYYILSCFATSVRRQAAGVPPVRWKWQAARDRL
ncbi:MAG: ATP phosphoribosyltransferase regulatory subunit [Ruminococcus sp.]